MECLVGVQQIEGGVEVSNQSGPDQARRGGHV
jgi:hypothetical protein